MPDTREDCGFLCQTVCCCCRWQVIFDIITLVIYFSCHVLDWIIFRGDKRILHRDEEIHPCPHNGWEHPWKVVVVITVHQSLLFFSEIKLASCCCCCCCCCCLVLINRKDSKILGEKVTNLDSAFILDKDRLTLFFTLCEVCYSISICVIHWNTRNAYQIKLMKLRSMKNCYRNINNFSLSHFLPKSLNMLAGQFHNNSMFFAILCNEICLEDRLKSGLQKLNYYPTDVCIIFLNVELLIIADIFHLCLFVCLLLLLLLLLLM